jgi:Rgg/GadR/MutR family transcriptional activator
MFDHLVSGNAIRSIREAKGYTQKFVSDNIIRQSTYSKIERGEIEPAASKFFALLDRIEMTVEEFLYIQNEYSHTGKGEIIYNFVHSSYNNPSELKALKEKAAHYLESHNDVLVQNILTVCNALIHLAKSQDISAIREEVKPVWERLEKFDQWFLTELYLLNSILYLFPTETAIPITQRAVEELEKYRGFERSSRLRFNFQFNLVFLLLHNKEFTNALNLLEELILEAKKMKYHDLLAICYTRKGIAALRLGDEKGQDFIDRGLRILEVIEENQLREQAIREVDNLLSS